MLNNNHDETVLGWACLHEHMAVPCQTSPSSSNLVHSRLVRVCRDRLRCCVGGIFL